MPGAVVGSMQTGVRLDRALTRARTDAGGAPEIIQAFGQLLSPPDYEAWRRQIVERQPEATLPTAEEGSFALVLWMMRPGALADAINERRMRQLLSPPYVGVFDPSVRGDIAFASMIAGWVDQAESRGSLALQPPVLEERDAVGERRCYTLMLGAEHYVQK